MSFLIQYWYFHIPNYLMAAVMYTMLGRQLLALFVPPQWNNYIWLSFCRLTDPVINIVALATPQIISPKIMPLVAFFWLLVLRALYALILMANGLLNWNP